MPGTPAPNLLTGVLRGIHAQENPSLKNYLSFHIQTHIISWRWSSAGDFQKLHLDRRWPWSQHLLLGPVPWEATLLMTRALPLENTEREQAGPVLEGELLVSGPQGRQPQAGRLPTCCPLSPSPEWHQKRQEPRRLWAWRRSADRERLMCLAVERTRSAAWTARLRALWSSSRSSRSSGMECRCPPAGRERAAGGHSAASRAQGAEVGPPGGAQNLRRQGSAMLTREDWVQLRSARLVTDPLLSPREVCPCSLGLSFFTSLRTMTPSWRNIFEDEGR